MTDSGEKTCPNCAENVKTEAKVCRFCSYNFETGQSPNQRPNPSAPEAKRGCGNTVLIIGAIIVGLIVLAALFGGGSKNSATGGESATAGPARSVTAQDLFSAYQANEASAQQEYGDQSLAVSGTVDGVDLDFSNNPVVKLQTSNQFMSIQAQLTDASKSKASGLSKGQTVVLTCSSVSEVVGTPMLDDCEIP